MSQAPLPILILSGIRAAQCLKNKLPPKYSCVYNQPLSGHGGSVTIYDNTLFFPIKVVSPSPGINFILGEYAQNRIIIGNVYIHPNEWFDALSKKEVLFDAFSSLQKLAMEYERIPILIAGDLNMKPTEVGKTLSLFPILQQNFGLHIFDDYQTVLPITESMKER